MRTSVLLVLVAGVGCGGSSTEAPAQCNPEGLFHAWSNAACSFDLSGGSFGATGNVTLRFPGGDYCTLLGLKLSSDGTITTKGSGLVGGGTASATSIDPTNDAICAGFNHGAFTWQESCTADGAATLTITNAAGTALYK